MLHLVVRSIGKTSEDWQHDALDQYRKRIISLAQLEEHVLQTPKRQRHSNIDQLREKEHNLLCDSINENTFVFALDERGSSFTTPKLTQKLQHIQQHYKKIVFIIGGPDGLHERTRERSHQMLSLSQFTLPHIFAKIVLYEQLYRCLSLINHHPYHR